MTKGAARTQISTDAIIVETAKLAFVNMMDYLRIGESGEPFRSVGATRA